MRMGNSFPHKLKPAGSLLVLVRFGGTQLCCLMQSALQAISDNENKFKMETLMRDVLSDDTHYKSSQTNPGIGLARTTRLVVQLLPNSSLPARGVRLRVVSHARSSDYPIDGSSRGVFGNAYQLLGGIIRTACRALGECRSLGADHVMRRKAAWPYAGVPGHFLASSRPPPVLPRNLLYRSESKAVLARQGEGAKRVSEKTGPRMRKVLLSASSLGEDGGLIPCECV